MYDKIFVGAKIEPRITMELSEQEFLALSALTPYGTESFLKFFYEFMGVTCLKAHEEGLKSLFRRVQGECSGVKQKISAARTALKG